jgi:hypothetical protein
MEFIEMIDHRALPSTKNIFQIGELGIKTPFLNDKF